MSEKVDHSAVELRNLGFIVQYGIKHTTEHTHDAGKTRHRHIHEHGRLPTEAEVLHGIPHSETKHKHSHDVVDTNGEMTEKQVVGRIEQLTNTNSAYIFPDRELSREDFEPNIKDFPEEVQDKVNPDQRQLYDLIDPNNPRPIEGFYSEPVEAEPSRRTSADVVEEALQQFIQAVKEIEVLSTPIATSVHIYCSLCGDDLYVFEPQRNGSYPISAKTVMKHYMDTHWGLSAASKIGTDKDLANTTTPYREAD